MFGGNEWIIIVIVALVLFGGSQIPKLARSLGQAQKEFKQGIAEGSDDETSATPSTDTPSSDTKK
jgi:sec-independent protein translocase protein TatA